MALFIISAYERVFFGHTDMEKRIEEDLTNQWLFVILHMTTLKIEE